MPGRRDSEEKADASTVVAKHWRGLTRRVAVLRKWSWVVGNNFDHKDEEKMLDLGLFVQSIEHELAAEPSLRRRSTSGVQQLTRGASSTAAAGSSDAPVQRDFSLTFPLREPDVLEMIASFSRGRRVDAASVEKLLELQVELLRPLPNVVRYEVPAGQVSLLLPQTFRHACDHVDADRSGPNHYPSLPDRLPCPSDSLASPSTPSSPHAPRPRDALPRSSPSACRYTQTRSSASWATSMGSSRT